MPDGIVRRLSAAGTVLAVTHARPDGDALGSLAGLVESARTAGKSARALVPDTVPDRYAFLFPDGPPAGPEAFADLAARADAVVILDTCALAQLDVLAGALPAARDKTIVVDHHATPDDIGTARWIDTSASATGVMVLELLRAMHWAVRPRAAEALAAAIVSDTGWLRFPNTDPRTLRALALLLEAGVRPEKLHARLFQSDRSERLRLLGRVLGGLELYAGGRLAVMTLRRRDFEETGARPDETENLVNEALRIAGVEAAALLTENEGVVRVGLRSRETLDVSAVARRFGGGGHARAAGFRSPEPLDDLKRRLLADCQQALGQCRT